MKNASRAGKTFSGKTFVKQIWTRQVLAVIGGTAAAVTLMLLSVPAMATDSQDAAQSSMTKVAAEELDRRSRQPKTSQGGGLSESSVRVMLTYAFSIIPDKVKDTTGEMSAVDKSDPNKFVIPLNDARRVIRVATRSAYAELCGMPELGKSNYNTMIQKEQAKQTWTREQFLMIDALHLFAVSYFTGNAKFSDKAGGAPGSPANEAETDRFDAPPPPSCPPAQRQKVESAINAYVTAAGAN